MDPKIQYSKVLWLSSLDKTINKKSRRVEKRVIMNMNGYATKLQKESKKIKNKK